MSVVSVGVVSVQRLPSILSSLTKNCLGNVNDILAATAAIGKSDNCSVCELLGKVVEEPLCLIADNTRDIPIDRLVSLHCVRA